MTKEVTIFRTKCSHSHDAIRGAEGKGWGAKQSV